MTDDKGTLFRRYLDSERLTELFNLQGPVYATRGGGFDGDIWGRFAELRESGPVHEGVPGPLVGFHDPAFFQGIPEADRPHYSAFDYETVETIVRNPEIYSSSVHLDGSSAALHESSMLQMDGQRHHRYRALVQPSFVPKRAQWWLQNWIQSTVDALIDNVVENGRADLNIEVFAPIPMLTICDSFGMSIPEALEIRAAVTTDGLGLGKFIDLVTPIIPERRAEPTDDLISVLVQAEITDDDGERHVLTDDEILSFAFLLLAAGSGTTWKQMGIVALMLLERPEFLERLREDRTLLRPAIEEVMRISPTDPVFSRWTTVDTMLGGVDIPAGAVVHMVFGAANRDPKRWENPDEFDPGRPVQSHFGFGGGHHICLGMHVARAEITCVLDALLDRLPNLRLDPDAPPAKVTGMYERGPTAVPVVWDAPDTEAVR